MSPRLVHPNNFPCVIPTGAADFGLGSAMLPKILTQVPRSNSYFGLGRAPQR